MEDNSITEACMCKDIRIPRVRWGNGAYAQTVCDYNSFLVGMSCYMYWWHIIIVLQLVTAAYYVTVGRRGEIVMVGGSTPKLVNLRIERTDSFEIQ